MYNIYQTAHGLQIRACSILQDNSGTVLFNKYYYYDLIGNIIFLQDNLQAAGEDLYHSYAYDSDSRLINASAFGATTSYNLSMDYSPAGSILHKDLQGTGLDNSGNFSINFVNDYHYNHTNPYAVSNLFGTFGDNLYWDNAGNLCFKKGAGEHFYWTEDNRMQAYYHQGTSKAAHYRYDAGGERDLKLVGDVQNLYNQGHYYRVPVFTDAVLYASPLVTVNKNGYVKHYFAETERILSNIGGGTTGNANVNPYEEIPSITRKSAYELSDIFSGFASNYLDEVNNKPNVCVNNDIDYPADRNIPSLYDIFANALQQQNKDRPFYFHSDHLAGASMITNSQGQFYQALAYCPYGEPLIDVSNGSGYDVEHKFTGQIFDKESGLYSFPARPQDPFLGIFISTDKKWYLYPHLTPYHYCSNNPIMITDPTGMADPLTMMKVRRMAKWNTFGMVRNSGTKAHQGIDYHALVGTPISAIKDGKVVAVSNGKDYGLGLTLEFTGDNGETRYAYYGHLSEISVGNLNYKENDLPVGTYNTLKDPVDVKEGDKLGKTGDSGNAKGMGKEDQHLHFENRDKGSRLGTGLADRKDPNDIVDTKFKDDPKNAGKVIQVQQPKETDK